MHRNLDRRVEALLRVADEPLAARLGAVLDSCLDPATRCWTLGPRRRVVAVAVAGFGRVARARPPGRDDAAATRGSRRRGGMTASTERLVGGASPSTSGRRARSCGATTATSPSCTGPRYDDWSFPKGKLEHGETDAVRGRARGRRGDRARRAPRPDARRRVATRCPRAARWCGTGRRAWRRTTGSPPTRRSTSCAGSPPGRPPRSLTYGHDLDVLQRFVAHGRPTSTILLVRHGKAGSRSQWDGDDDERPLSSSGREQAEHLGRAPAALRARADRERAAAALPRHDRAAGRGARAVGRRRAAAGRGRLLGAAARRPGAPAPARRRRQASPRWRARAA